MNDLSPIVVTDVIGEDLTLHIDPPLFLQPSIIPSIVPNEHDLWIADYEDFNFCVYTYSRDELLQAIDEQLLYLYSAYVLSKSPLSQDAQELRDKLMERITV
jgi:hypothetical protein